MKPEKAHKELQAYRSSVYFSFDRPAPKHSSHIFRLFWVPGGVEAAWLVVIGVPGKPFTWNHLGFHPGKTVYPREPPPDFILRS